MKQVITDKELLLLVETQPVLSCKDVAKFYDVTETTASHRLNRLFTAGKLGRKNIRPPGERGIEYGYFRPMKRKEPTANGYLARLEEAQAEIIALREWQAEALRRYPDLAVPDIVFRARQIVAKAAPEHREEALDGRLDKKPIMLATIAALEEVS